MDPESEPGGPKTCGSGGSESRSATLLGTVKRPFSTPFYRKTVISLKYVLAAPPLKIFGGMYKFGIYVVMKSSLQF
jgi:hypothetical protein